MLVTKIKGFRKTQIFWVIFQQAVTQMKLIVQQTKRKQIVAQKNIHGI